LSIIYVFIAVPTKLVMLIFLCCSKCTESYSDSHATGYYTV